MTTTAHIFTIFLTVASAWVLASSGAFSQSQDDYQRAMVIYGAKNYEAAIPLFTKAAQSGNVRATYYLALCYQYLKQDTKAIELFRHISKNFKGTAEATLCDSYLQRIPQSSGAQASSQAASTASAQASSRTEPAAKAAAAAALDALRQKGEQISEAQWKALPEKARIPFQMKDGHMWVQAKVNGSYINVVFDTGASKCTLSLTDFPNLFSDADLSKGQTILVSRPHGNEQMSLIETEINLHNITRKCSVALTHSAGISVIGQNFFKEYTYEIDGFYLRLTKAPWVKPEIASEKPAEKGKIIASSNHVAEVRKNQTHDKYSLPFVRQHDILLVDIEVNGHKTQACFDTGCAPDGIVVPPGMRTSLGLQENSDGVYAENIVIGPITRKYVKAYPAANLPVLLIGPKLFGDRRYVIDPVNNLIKFQY